MLGVCMRQAFELIRSKIFSWHLYHCHVFEWNCSHEKNKVWLNLILIFKLEWNKGEINSTSSIWIRYLILYFNWTNWREHVCIHTRVVHILMTKWIYQKFDADNQLNKSNKYYMYQLFSMSDDEQGYTICETQIIHQSQKNSHLNDSLNSSTSFVPSFPNPNDYFLSLNSNAKMQNEQI